jgi:hypothetical protein
LLGKAVRSALTNFNTRVERQHLLLQFLGKDASA